MPVSLWSKSHHWTLTIYVHSIFKIVTIDYVTCMWGTELCFLTKSLFVLFAHQVWCGINVWLDANQIFVSTVLGFLSQYDSFQCINTLPEYRLRGEVWNCFCQHEKVLDWKQSNVQGKCLSIGMIISFRMNTNTSCNKGLLIFLKNFCKKGHYILSYTPPPSLTYVLLNTV